MTHSSASAPAKCDSDPGRAAPELLLVKRDHRVGDVLQQPSAGLLLVLGIGVGVGHDRPCPLPLGASRKGWRKMKTRKRRLR